MPQFSLQALDILIDEPPELAKLYLCLVSNMNIESAIVGISYRLNEAYFRERLSIAAVHGRKRIVPTRQKVRSTLARMITLSLLVDRGKHVYYLPFENVHQSVQKDYNPKFNHSTTNVSFLKTNTYDRLKPINNPNNNLHLYNNINNGDSGESTKKQAFCEKLSSAYSTRGEDDRFAMSLDWQCDRDLIKAYLLKRADDPSKIDVDWMVEYQGYWLARPHIQRTQAEWDIHLANYLSQFIRDPQRFDSLNGLSAE